MISTANHVAGHILAPSPGRVITRMIDGAAGVTSFHEGRDLSRADIDLLAGTPGTCQVRTSLDTLYTGEVKSYGAVFTIRALTDPVEIQSFEFANIDSDGSHDVNIYAKSDTVFSTNLRDWTELTSARSVRSADGLGAISPRAQMQNSITLSAGEEALVYLTLNTPNLRMAETADPVGTVYQSDDFLELMVGQSIEDLPELMGTRTGNRAFQGKLHYRVLKDCSTLGTETELTFPFAAEPGTDRRELNAAVSAGFINLLNEEADLARWQNVYGLSIDGVELRTKGALGKPRLIHSCFVNDRIQRSNQGNSSINTSSRLFAVWVCKWMRAL